MDHSVETQHEHRLFVGVVAGRRRAAEQRARALLLDVSASDELQTGASREHPASGLTQDVVRGWRRFCNDLATRWAQSDRWLSRLRSNDHRGCRFPLAFAILQAAFTGAAGRIAQRQALPRVAREPRATTRKAFRKAGRGRRRGGARGRCSGWARCSRRGLRHGRAHHSENQANHPRRPPNQTPHAAIKPKGDGAVKLTCGPLPRPITAIFRERGRSVAREPRLGQPD